MGTPSVFVNIYAAVRTLICKQLEVNKIINYAKDCSLLFKGLLINLTFTENRVQKTDNKQICFVNHFQNYSFLCKMYSFSPLKSTFLAL